MKSQTNKDRNLKNIISNNNLYPFNKKSQTHLHLFSATYSTIDLSFCDPSLFFNFTWLVKEDTSESNHFLTVIESLHPQEHLAWWKINKTEWSLDIYILNTSYKMTLFTVQTISLKNWLQYKKVCPKQLNL